MPSKTAGAGIRKNDGEGGIRVIARAADVLGALAHHPDGLTLSEIAQQVGLARSTVQRIVSALDDANLVIAVSPTAGVRLGPALVALAAAARPFDVVEFARPVMAQLAKDLGETVDLAGFGNNKAVVVDQIPGIHPLVAVSAVGSSLPLHCTASGKALLASLPDREFDKLGKHLPLPATTPNAITDWGRLRKEIEQVRGRRVAFDREEFRPGICAVAMALRLPGGAVAAVTLPAPTERFNATERTLTEALVERCQALQRRLMR
jgi:IclR family transcriptional regulator, acetate operon repressor